MASTHTEKPGTAPPGRTENEANGSSSWAKKRRRVSSPTTDFIPNSSVTQGSSRRRCTRAKRRPSISAVKAKLCITS